MCTVILIWFISASSPFYRLLDICLFYHLKNTAFDFIDPFLLFQRVPSAFSFNFIPSAFAGLSPAFSFSSLQVNTKWCFQSSLFPTRCTALSHPSVSGTVYRVCCHSVFFLSVSFVFWLWFAYGAPPPPVENFVGKSRKPFFTCSYEGIFMFPSGTFMLLCCTFIFTL